MSEQTSAWQSSLYGIVPHPHERRILMLSEPQAAHILWALPLVTLSHRIWFLHLGWVTTAMRHLLEREVIALRYAQLVTDGEQHRVTGIYILENRAPEASPPLGGRWISQDQLQELPLAVPAQRAVLETYFAEINHHTPPDHRSPWAMPSWYATVEAWIGACLESQGYELRAPLEQVRVWGVSCVLRAQTSTGDFYFKSGAAWPFAAQEPQLTSALASRYPDSVPTPRWIEPTRSWMLLPDMGPPLSETTPPAVLHSAYRALAEIQCDFAGQHANVLALGCTDRRLEQLVSHIDVLMANLGRIRGLHEAEIARLQACVPQLKEQCWQLARLGVPASLVHGDFRAGNIARSGERALIFDWAEGCLAHPFFDMLDLFEREGSPLQQELRDSYLAVWAQHTSMETLQEAWTVAKPIAALHTAVSSLSIITHLEEAAQDQLAWAVPHWLRFVLRSMDP